MKKLIVAVLAALTLVACSDDKVVDNSNVGFLTLAAVGGSNDLRVVDLADGSIVYQDVLSEVAGVKANSKITRIKEFGGAFFICVPDDYKIYSIDKQTFELLDEIDFSEEELTPHSICFPNSSNAYVACSNSNVVKVYDLKNRELARTIEVRDAPVDIAGVGNQVYTANRDDNTLSIIDTREHKQVALMPVSDAPYFLETAPQREKIIAVSLGAGKIDTNDQKTAAKMYLIDYSNRTIVSEKEIGFEPTFDPKEVTPFGIAVTRLEQVYFPTDMALFKTDAFSAQYVGLMNRFDYRSASYSYSKDKLILLKNMDNNMSIVVADPAGAKEESSRSIDFEAYLIHAVK